MPPPRKPGAAERSKLARAPGTRLRTSRTRLLGCLLQKRAMVQLLQAVAPAKPDQREGGRERRGEGKGGGGRRGEGERESEGGEERGKRGERGREEGREGERTRGEREREKEGERGEGEREGEKGGREREGGGSLSASLCNSSLQLSLFFFFLHPLKRTT